MSPLQRPRYCWLLTVEERHMSALRISAFYYYRYGSDLPADPGNAADTMTVEVGGPDSTIDCFDTSYHFVVVTRQYLQRCPSFLQGREHRFFRSLLIVDRFEDDIIRRAIEAILPDIGFYGFPENRGLPDPPPPAV
jgi:hypothetical protein